MTKRAALSYDEAVHEIRLASRRIALLHLAFSEAAVETLGNEAGRRLIRDAIRTYGTLIGREVRAAVLRQGLEPNPENFDAGDSRSLPRLGMHTSSEVVQVGEEVHTRAYGCVLADVWEEHGAQELGRLYCLVDPAKYMAYNPNYTMAHVRARPSGDEFCEFCIRPTTEEERASFTSRDGDWMSADCPRDKDRREP